MASSMTGTEPGHYIVGELLGVELPRSFDLRTPRPDGTTTGQSRPKVRLLVGATVQVIAFKSLPELKAAIGDPKERELVAVPVWVNGPYNEATNRSLPHNASFAGRAPRHYDGEAE